ncbi:MAG: RDD family protein [Chloroflexaceae bacterium]|jgi:uncharacterized RDD family membrane protein YckC|nr:RDD family protein [Chloroflexaceae bacterium]
MNPPGHTETASQVLFVRRIAAYLMNMVCLFGVLAPVAFGVQRLFQIKPTSGVGIWHAALLSFSVPTWFYCVLCDAAPAGATVGKSLWQLQVTGEYGQRLTLPRAGGRTAIKLLPWELVHLAVVFYAPDRTAHPVQLVVVVLSNVLSMLYLAVALRTKGQQRVHDRIIGTQVQHV